MTESQHCLGPRERAPSRKAHQGKGVSQSAQQAAEGSALRGLDRCSPSSQPSELGRWRWWCSHVLPLGGGSRPTIQLSRPLLRLPQPCLGHWGQIKA